MTTTRIEGKVALVTAAERGNGLALTRALLKRGAAKVYATAYDLCELPKLHDRFGERFVGVQLDLTDSKRIADVARMASDTQILINCANVAIGSDVCPDATFENARYEMEVNYFGPLQLITRMADDLAINGDALVVNVSSVAGLASSAEYPSYSASMAALHSLTQAARVRLAGDDIAVVGVYPAAKEANASVESLVGAPSPARIAGAIIAGIEKGLEDIYPDERALCFAQRYLDSPKAAEREAAARIGKPPLVN